MHPASPAKQTWLTTLGWAAYLACSWTWCIGMFLPVLLVRDFGIWGFVVFAVPNVVGAAAMGWVLTGPGAAASILTTHRRAVRAFSTVTITFQWFFVGWLFASNLDLRDVGSLAPIGFALVIIPIVMVLRRRADPVRLLTAITLVLSFLVMGYLAVRGDLKLPTLERSGSAGSSVLWLAPVCAFGFALCPYLDGTFILARKSQRPIAGTISFIVGFVGLFLPMIIFTLLYANQFDAAHSPARLVSADHVVKLLIAAHIFGQILATTVTHTDAADVPGPGRSRLTSLILMAGGLVVGCIGSVLQYWSKHRYAGLDLGEVTYRLFMSFYGLVFPAYVWLCMIPVRGERGTQQPSRQKLTVLAIAIALASPCFWMGFIERQTWWLGPGLGIVLLARLFIPRPATSGDRSVPSNA